MSFQVSQISKFSGGACPHLVEVNKQFVSPLVLTREPHFEVGVNVSKSGNIFKQIIEIKQLSHLPNVRISMWLPRIASFLSIVISHR